MARRLLFQTVIAPATITAGAGLNAINTDGTLSVLANPDLGVTNFGANNPKAALLNCDPYNALQIAVSSQVQTGGPLTLFLYYTYPNGNPPVGAGETAYGNPSVVLGAAGNNLLITLGAVGGQNATAGNATLAATSFSPCPQWLLPALFFSAAVTASSPLTISVWGVQGGFNYY